MCGFILSREMAVRIAFDMGKREIHVLWNQREEISSGERRSAEMKKGVSLILAAALMLSLAACGGGGGATSDGENGTSSATIITNEGDTVTMTAQDLIDAYDSNEASFNKLYQYAEIQFTGTISNIKVDTSVIVEPGSVMAGQQKIVFEEGWCLVLSEDNTTYDLADFNAGDVVEVTTSIVGAPFDTEFLQTVSDGNRVVWLVGDDIQLKEFVRNDVVLHNCGIETVIEPVEES